MDLHSAIRLIASRFQYKKDDNRLVDSWSIMKERDGKYRGDCEDFSLTVFWHMSDKNLFKFLFNLCVTHKYGLIWCKTKTGELHMIGRYGDLYFDNWTLAALEKNDFFQRTGHRKIMQMVMPLCIVQLIKGLFKR